MTRHPGSLLWLGRRLPEFLRFGFVGAGNTVLTLLLYQVLVSWIHHQFAYLISWLIGITLVVWIYPSFVYRRRMKHPMGNLRIASAYLAIYLASAALLETLHRVVDLSPRTAVLVVLVFTALANYLILGAIAHHWGVRSDLADSAASDNRSRIWRS